MPRSSNISASSTLLELHDPQSPTPDTMKSEILRSSSAASSVTPWLGERLRIMRLTVMPWRRASCSPSFLSITSELNLVFSTRPTRRPARSRARGARVTVRSRGVEVGSKSFMACSSWAWSSWAWSSRGVDDSGDAPGPLVTPAGQTRRPAPRLTARADDEDVLGALEGALVGVLVGGLDLPWPAARALEVGDGAARVLHEKAPHVGLAPAALAQDVAVLAREHDERLVVAAQVRRPEVAEGVGEAAQQGLGRRGELVVHQAQAVGGVHGDRALVGAAAALDVQRIPRVIDLVLGEAERVLARVAEGRAVEEPRAGVHRVHHGEAHRATDRGVGASALAEDVVARVDADAPRDGPVDDQDHG